MLIRLVAIIYFALALPLLAQDCTGKDFLDELSADQQSRLTDAARSHPFAEGILWQARRGQTELTIFGSMHIPDPMIDALLPKVSTYLLAADMAFFENTKADLARFEQEIKTEPDLVYNNAGPTLPELLNEAEWQVLSDALRARGFPPFLASKMWPWLVSMTVAIPPCVSLSSIASEKGSDQQLMDMAEDAGIQQHALDEWDVALKIFATMPLDQQLDMLRWSLPDLGRGDDLYVTTRALYLQGRVREIWELTGLLAEISGEVPPGELGAFLIGFEDLLLTRRNISWAETLSAVPDGTKAFVAVGALHLSGANGVLNLLEEAGFEVERLGL